MAMANILTSMGINMKDNGRIICQMGQVRLSIQMGVDISASSWIIKEMVKACTYQMGIFFKEIF